MCATQTLFSPSFSTRLDGPACKSVATKGYLLSNAIGSALENGTGVRMTAKVLAIPERVDDSGVKRGALRESWLIPGGSLLVLFSNNAMEAVDITLPTPEVVVCMELKGAVNSGFMRLVYKNVVAGGGTCQMVYQTLGSESVDEEKLAPGDFAATYVFLELSRTASGSVDVKVKGQVVMIREQGRVLNSVYVAGDKVFFLSEGLTIAWDSAAQSYMGWYAYEEEDTSNTTIVANDDAVVYVCSNGIYAVRTSGLQAIKGNTIAFGTFSENWDDSLLRSWFIIDYPICEDRDNASPTLSFIAQMAVGKTIEVTYDIHEVTLDETPWMPYYLHEGSSDGMVRTERIHRYTLTVDTSKPSPDTATLSWDLPRRVVQGQDHTAPLAQPHRALDRQPLQRCALGGVASLWVDIINGPAFLEQTWPGFETSDGHLAIAPLALPERDPRWDLHLGSSMCVATAKIVSLWSSRASNNVEGEPRECLILYELDEENWRGVPNVQHDCQPRDELGWWC